MYEKSCFLLTPWGGDSTPAGAYIYNKGLNLCLDLNPYRGSTR